MNTKLIDNHNTAPQPIITRSDDLFAEEGLDLFAEELQQQQDLAPLATKATLSSVSSVGGTYACVFCVGTLG